MHETQGRQAPARAGAREFVFRLLAGLGREKNGSSEAGSAQKLPFVLSAFSRIGFEIMSMASDRRLESSRKVEKLLNTIAICTQLPVFLGGCQPSSGAIGRPYQFISAAGQIPDLADFRAVSSFLKISIDPNATSSNLAYYVKVDGIRRLDWVPYISGKEATALPGVSVDYTVSYPGGPANFGSTVPLGKLTFYFNPNAVCVSKQGMDLSFGRPYWAIPIFDGTGMEFAWHISRGTGKPVSVAGAFESPQSSPGGCTTELTLSE